MRHNSGVVRISALVLLMGHAPIRVGASCKVNGVYAMIKVQWRWQRFVWWLQDKIRLIWNNNQCSVCGASVPSYPCNPFKKTWCEEHCPDHDYVYERDMGGKFCKHCSKPYDYYHDCD